MFYQKILALKFYQKILANSSYLPQNLVTDLNNRAKICNSNTKPSVLHECFHIQCYINLHNPGPNTSWGGFVPFSNFEFYMLFPALSLELFVL